MGRAAIAALVYLTWFGTVPAAAHEPTAHKNRHAQPTPLSQTAPDRTSAISLARVVVDEPLPPLFNLPVAPRARMRVCGEKWQAIKIAGTSGNEIWRDFADKCLAEKN